MYRCPETDEMYNGGPGLFRPVVWQIVAYNCSDHDATHPVGPGCDAVCSCQSAPPVGRNWPSFSVRCATNDETPPPSTSRPTSAPPTSPTTAPSTAPSGRPTTTSPTAPPTSAMPSGTPTSPPTALPSEHPTGHPTAGPTGAPTTARPTTTVPTAAPTSTPSAQQVAASGKGETDDGGTGGAGIVVVGAVCACVVLAAVVLVALRRRHTQGPWQGPPAAHRPGRNARPAGEQSVHVAHAGDHRYLVPMAQNPMYGDGDGAPTYLEPVASNPAYLAEQDPAPGELGGAGRQGSYNSQRQSATTSSNGSTDTGALGQTPPAYLKPVASNPEYIAKKDQVSQPLGGVGCQRALGQAPGDTADPNSVAAQALPPTKGVKRRGERKGSTYDGFGAADAGYPGSTSPHVYAAPDPDQARVYDSAKAHRESTRGLADYSLPLCAEAGRRRRDVHREENVQSSSTA